MASRQARQERLLERQRGAGRQVKDTDVRLVLPGAENALLEPRKSGRPRKTPQPAQLPPQRSSRRTPAKELLPQRSSRRTPASQLIPQPSSQRTPATQGSDAKRPRGRPPSATLSAKRPRRDGEEVNVDAGLGSSQSHAAKRVKLRHQPELTATTNETAPRSNEVEPRKTSENLAPSPGTERRRKRKYIGQQSLKRPRSNVLQDHDDPGARTAASRGWPKAIRPEELAVSLDDEIQNQLRRENSSLVMPDTVHSPVLPSVEPIHGTGFTPKPKKRKKRISIGQQTRKKPKHNLVTVKEEPDEEFGRIIDDVPAPPETFEEEDELNDGFVANTVEEARKNAGASGEVRLFGEARQATAKGFPTKPMRKKRRSIGQQKPKKVARDRNTYTNNLAEGVTRPKGPSKVSEARIQENLNRSKTKKTQKRPAAQTGPASRRNATSTQKEIEPDARPKAKSAPQTTASSKPSQTSTSGRPATNTIPITVYRPPTPEFSDDEAAYPQRAPRTFNAVDVLAQITHERLENLAIKFNARLSTSRTQRKALELYTTEVESRLRQLSTALDTSKTLSTEVKRLGRQERALKAKVKEVEAQQKEVREKKEELEGRRKRAELENLLGRIGEVARKGWALEKEKGVVGGDR